jgi:hypothetical protein
LRRVRSLALYGRWKETAISSLGSVLRLGKVKEREAYEALDRLVDRQSRIENGLARRHLQDGVLVLYDVSSSYFEGRCCPLARYDTAAITGAIGRRLTDGIYVIRTRRFRPTKTCRESNAASDP